MTSTDLPRRLAATIAAEGPIPIERFMAEANRVYYAARDPLGVSGDFITAPEISQMFGELIGAWTADLWQRAGSPDIAWVELGPGRGTLAADALRAMRPAGLTPPVHFVETSPVLRAAQAERVPHAAWHDDTTTLPDDRPLIIVANEFFDALPVRQLVKTYSGWRERMVGHGPEGFFATPGAEPHDAKIPPSLLEAQAGSLLESSPTAQTLVHSLAQQIARQGGALLIIDYGYAEHAAGDTLQAVHAHAFADPFANPGTSDLTAHVDFSALAAIAHAAGVRVHGPATQGDWLGMLGIAHRAAALARANPAEAEALTSAHQRLTSAEEMGQLFKVLALTHANWPEPAGF